MKPKRNRLLVERPLVDTSEAARPREGRRARTRVARSVTVNLAESPLGWLKSRGHVTARQYDAGDRLREDWERAQYAPGVTMRWDPAALGGGGGRGASEEMSASDAQIAARRRFEDAVAAVGGGLSDVLWRVVCAGEGMRDVEQALGWPARAGKLVLILALDRLADHYRIR
jgi:hypothetical protein